MENFLSLADHFFFVSSSFFRLHFIICFYKFVFIFIFIFNCYSLISTTQWQLCAHSWANKMADGNGNGWVWKPNCCCHCQDIVRTLKRRINIIYIECLIGTSFWVSSPNFSFPFAMRASPRSGTAKIDISSVGFGSVWFVVCSSLFWLLKFSIS